MCETDTTMTITYMNNRLMQFFLTSIRRGTFLTKMTQKKPLFAVNRPVIDQYKLVG